MAKTIFEEMGGTNAICKSIKEQPILLILLCSQADYLPDIDKQAEDMFLRMVKQMAEREDVTEQLKDENPMEWVRRINNICSRTIEIVNNDLIYT